MRISRERIESIREGNNSTFIPRSVSIGDLLAAIDERDELLAKAVEVLRLVKQTLTIPAAEYVPAIPDAWDIIDAVLKELE